MKKFSSCCKTSILVALALSLAATSRADSGAAPIKASTAVPGANSYIAKGDNINIRSRPAKTADILGKIRKGATVSVLETKTVTEGNTTNDWLRIGLPADAKCYVSSALLKDGAASTDAINVRSGPGTNFKEIGKLDKGQKVEIVKLEGEWTRIKPTAQCSGWVAAEFFEAVAQVPAAPPVINTTEIKPVPPVAPPPVAPPPVIETRTVEVEVEVQVQYVVKDGIFRKITSDEKTPAPYELLTLDVERRQYRIAFLEIKDGGLEKFDGKHVRVLGNERWRKGERYPVIAVERLEPVL